jgi:hypothetical protein
MKKIYFTLTLAALIMNSGCSPKSSEDIAKETQTKLDLLKQDNDKQLEALSEISNSGGQPAHITMGGKGLKNGEHLNTKYYSISVLGGQRCESEEAEVVKDSQGATLSKLDEDKESFKDLGKTFVNIGCGKNLDKKLTTGLTDATISEMKKLVASKKVWMITASKIFVCGSIDLSKMTLVHFKADEVHLSNAVLTTGSKNTINLSLATNKLILDGASSFSSLLKDETMPSLVSPTTEVSLTVAQETQGTGVLSITAKGANCIKAEKE